MAPRVGIGMTLYNNAAYLPETLESFLSQTYGDFNLVLLDDCSSDQTEKVARDYASRDKRIVYYRNDKREGLVNSWRKVFLLCQGQSQLDYFSWASDHDVWHPEWLACLLADLNEHRQAVLAYPLTQGIDERGKFYEKPSFTFDTFGVSDRRKRFIAVCSMRGNAGNMVYGLFRADALAQTGVFCHVLVPDRFLLAELSLYGEFKQIQKVLWYRRFRKKVTLRRQRINLFSKPPFYTYFPWWLTHAATLLWRLTVRPTSDVGVSRLEGICLAWLLMTIGAYRQFNKSQRKVLSKVKRVFDAGVNVVSKM
jgi:glycosyltransferase involved in cell wall biosynthesis